MRTELLFMVINCFVWFVGAIAVVAAIAAENKNKKLKAKVERLQRAYDYQKKVLNLYVKRDEDRQSKERTQVSVRLLDGKIVGYVGKK